MIISPPFLPATGLQSNDQSETDPMMAANEQFELAHHGVYPIAFDRRWHCGMHLAPTEQTEPVRAIADGIVIAYRVSGNAISDGQIDPQTAQPALNSNTGFVLLKHTTDTGDGRPITFYSLYMHLLDMTGQQQIANQPNNPPVNSSPTALPSWLLDTSAGDGVVQLGGNKRVYRKDMLGYWGACHGMPHLHFEIFMTEGDFTAWFEKSGHAVQLGEVNPVQPLSGDYWGHSYFVIPGGQTFVPAPQNIGVTNDQSHQPFFPRLNDGTLEASSTLYIEAYFYKGDRYARSWIKNGEGALTQLTKSPVKDPYNAYEYKLYERATKLYPACPSDGYELLRFGRILSEHPTLPEAQRATYVAVPFDPNGTMGYIDVNQSVILKLSDADFPFFTDWQKIGDDATPFDQDGLCGYAELTKLIGDVEAQSALPSQDATGAGSDGQSVPSAGANAAQPGTSQLDVMGAQSSEPADSEFKEENALTAYVQGHEAVRKRLKGFVCHATSEWDATHNHERYKGLNNADGFFGKHKDTDSDGYARFIRFRQQFQFLDQTPLQGGKRFWFFHPLAFIRHFRKCEWLSSQEIAQCIPRKFVTLQGTSLVSHSNGWQIAKNRGTAWEGDLNISMRKYQIASTKQRVTHFFAQVMEESGWLGAVREYYGETQSYSPYFGRGLIQLTNSPNYAKYGSFKKFPVDNSVQAAGFNTIGWNPNVLLAQSNSVFNRSNCADSAGLYWTCPAMTAIGVNSLQTSDNGIEISDIISSAKSTNGDVVHQNLNGLEHRVLSFTCIKYVLMDLIEPGETEVATFVWRRNSAREPILDQNGAPVLDPATHHAKKRYYPKIYNLNISLEKQRP